MQQRHIHKVNQIGIRPMIHHDQRERIRERNMILHSLPEGPKMLKKLLLFISWLKLEENPLLYADELDLGYVPGWGEEEEINLYLLLHPKC